MTRRWRPSLSLVLGGALICTLGFSLLGLIALRYLGPEIGFRRAAFLLALIIAIATATLGGIMVRLLLRPIRALEHFATEQENGKLPSPPKHFGTQELHATARRVIAMAEALRNREASVRAYTDHVTHELKTPVTTIRAGIELLEDGTALTPEDRRILSQIDAARLQLEGQLAALRETARARETRYIGNTTLSEVLPDLATENRSVSLILDGDQIPIPIAAEGLKIVLGHLIRNAVEHGATRISLNAQTVDETCELNVIDNGTGVSAGNAGRIFDPFFTSRREVGGTGMGLAIVRNILAAHHARIWLERSSSETCFRMAFIGNS